MEQTTEKNKALYAPVQSFVLKWRQDKIAFIIIILMELNI
jgi:hypothetical protein